MLDRNYKLQNCDIDTDWADIKGEEFEHAGDAIIRADELSEGLKGAICYGMVRVVSKDGAVVYVFSAGHT